MTKTFRAACVGLLTVLVTLPVAAQSRRATETVSPLFVPLTSPGDALAVDLNPAALGDLRAPSLVYVGVPNNDSGTAAVTGNSFSVATPLFLGLSAGGSVSFRQDALLGHDTSGRLALAWSPSSAFSLGISGRFWGASQGPMNHLATLDLAMSLRLTQVWAVSLIGRDLNSPSLADATSSYVPASGWALVAVRPFGTTALTVEAGAGYDALARVGFRASVQARVPYVGSVFAGVEMDDLSGQRNALVSAGLILQWEHYAAGGGALFNNGHLPTQPFVYASIEGANHDTALPGLKYVLDLEVESSSPRAMLSLLTTLDRASRDPRIAGVLLRPRGSGLGVARAQELRFAISTLRANGKPVVCHFDAATGAEAYACSAATATYVDPAGGIRLMGPSTEILSLGGALDHLGVHADFIRIGEFKSAPEEIANRTPSEPGLRSHEAFIDEVFGQLTSDFAHDLGVTNDAAHTLVDRGPYLAREAVAAHIAAGTADENDLGETLRDAFHGAFSRAKSIASYDADVWGVVPHVGVVLVDGDIVDGDSIDIPILGLHMSGGGTISRAIDSLARDSSVRAIVLRIDSPGGSALASDQIYRAIERAKRHKPVIASMGSVAASGGYYIAAACDEIWANPSTLTGSIGVFFGKVDVAELATHLGINVTFISRGAHAGAESMWRPFTPDERGMLAEKVRSWYRDFLSRVAAGRHMTLEEVDAVARGRVWSGAAAKDHKLVDRLGAFGEALARARVLGDLPDNAPMNVVPPRRNPILDFIFGSSSAHTSEDLSGVFAALPAPLRHALSLAVSFAHVREGVPFARLPYDMTDNE